MVEGVDNSCTVVPGDVVAAVAAVGEVVFGGVVEDDAEAVTDGVGGVVVTRRSEVWVESGDYTQERAGDSGLLPGSGQAGKLSRHGLGDSVQEPAEAGGRVHCTRFVEDKSAEKAWEGEGKNSGVHMNCMPGH
jgi:hypothetical protein